jgi:hypothetical protein
MRAEQVLVTNPLTLRHVLTSGRLPPQAPLQVRLEADERTEVVFELTAEGDGDNTDA